MSRPLYETPADRQREEAVIKKIAAHNNCTYVKLPMRDRLDYAMLRNGIVVALIEVKCRTIPHNKYETVMMTLDKVRSGRIMQELSRAPAFMAVQYTDKLGLLSFDCDYTVRVLGRTDRNDKQDIGLMALFSIDDFIFIGE